MVNTQHCTVCPRGIGSQVPVPTTAPRSPRSGQPLRYDAQWNTNLSPAEARHTPHLGSIL
jgi:hypothetical protein